MSHGTDLYMLPYKNSGCVFIRAGRFFRFDDEVVMMTVF